jgi:penicillin-binding protein 1A
MKAWIRIPLQLVTLGLLGLVVLTALVTGGYFYVEPTLPAAEELRDVRFQIPLRVYSGDGRLLQQYGEQKRTPIAYEEIPQVVINAFLAAEDDRFFQHSGIDYAGIVRGAIFFVTNPGERVPGGSTITQQVVRTANLMSRDYSLVRKFKEAILAFRVEDEFTKEEILGLFLNTTFFGQRANGIASAALTYFNKDVDELTLSEVAIIAGIPQGPSIMNPYNGPERAAGRRQYVLRRMYELGFITQSEREAALAEPIVSQTFDVDIQLSASYVGALAYEWCQRKFGKTSCDTAGLKITTTIDSRLQRVANNALRETLETYDRDHGYRGEIDRVDLAAVYETAAASERSEAEALDELLTAYPGLLDTRPAVVVSVNEAFADVYFRDTGLVSLALDSVSWARPYINDDRQGAFPDSVADVLTEGAVVRFRQLADGSFRLYQEPEVQGALVSVDPFDGAVVAMVGGYDFQSNAFNRATQGERQPGSSFKPFFYLSALANGYTLARIVNDAPLRFCDENLETCLSVRNYDGKAHGEVPLRYALTNSLNMAADRIVRDILPRNAIPILRRFGFPPRALPDNTSLALGSGVVTPLELAGAYSILANGGYAAGIANPDTGVVAPYFIQRVEDADGNVLYDARLSVETVCSEPEELSEDSAQDRPDRLMATIDDIYPPLRCAERVQQPQLIYLITDVLKDVVKRGSGRRTQQDPVLQRRTDLAGKTGTTSGPRDAWFAGFNADIVAVVRVGFDVDTRDLGSGEQGGVTAIPGWIEFMSAALDGMPNRSLPRPPGIEDRLVNPENGLLAADCNRTAATWEMFVSDNVPEREPDTVCFSSDPTVTTPNQNSGSDRSIF